MPKLKAKFTKVGTWKKQGGKWKFTPVNKSVEKKF